MFISYIKNIDSVAVVRSACYELREHYMLPLENLEKMTQRDE